MEGICCQCWIAEEGMFEVQLCFRFRVWVFLLSSFVLYGISYF